MSLSQNRFFARSGWLLAGLLLLAAAQSVKAEGETPAAIEADPAFDRYVDLDQLVEAWGEKDASLLADLDLQLAEGERILFRSHKSITADQVLSMATRVAVEKKDTKTLERLSRAATALKKTTLAAQVALGQKLAGASRAAEPVLAIPVNKMTPEGFVLFRENLDAITHAKIEGDSEALDIASQLIPKLTELSLVQRKYLVKLATEARTALGDDKIDPAVKALNKLVDSSLGIGAVAEVSSLRVKCASSANGLRVVGFTKDGPIAFAKSAKLKKGDLILRVGDSACSADTDLDSLVESAYEDDNLDVLVYVAKTRKVETYRLPSGSESKPESKKDDKTADSDSK